MVGINHPVFSHLDVLVEWEGTTGEEKGQGVGMGGRWTSDHKGGHLGQEQKWGGKHPVCATGCFLPISVIHSLAPWSLSEQLSEDTLFLENLRVHLGVE